MADSQSDRLLGHKVAILVADGFEQVEMTEPRKALDAAAATTRIVSPNTLRVRGWNYNEWGKDYSVDVPLKQAHVDSFDALHLPGGVMNPDTLRVNRQAVEFVKGFFDAGKPVSVICHGAWTIIEAGAAHGRRLTSWPSLKTDLCNAGAEWVDEPVVLDQDQLVSSRKPSDLPLFNQAMVRLFAERVLVHH